MSQVFFVTGAAGFLAGEIIRQLRSRGSHVVAGVLPGEERSLDGLGVSVVPCDVRDAAALDAALAPLDPAATTVVHTAGIVSIANTLDPALVSVNVGGTAQVIEAVRRHGSKRLVYTSSVHALPELPPGEIVREIDHFDPTAVLGGYAKSKAAATQLVLDATDLDRVVVHPSGIHGPGDRLGGHLTQLVADLMANKLPAITAGGHDLADVRDVAAGTIAAADRGRNGACYLLTGEILGAPWIADEVARLTGARRPPTVPLWLLRAAVPVMEWSAARRGVRPLVTRYALHQLRSGQVYSHELASRELGYTHRPPSETIADNIEWLRANPLP